MTRMLTLESFHTGPASVLPPEPVYSAADLAAARQEGWAEGRASAESEAAEALRQAVDGLAAALADDAGRRAAMAAGWRAELQDIAGAVARTLAGPLRADALAARVAAALAAEAEAAVPAPSRIRCAPASAPLLEALLTVQGATGITVDPSGEGAEFAAGDGIIRIDPARIEARLADIIAEIGATNGEGR